MRTRSLVLLLLAFVLSSGCTGGRRGAANNLPALVAATVLGGGRVALDPAAAQVFLGTLLLTNTLAADFAGGDIRYRIDAPPGVTADVPEGVIAPGQQCPVQVFTTQVAAAVISLTVLTNWTAGGNERSFAIQWINEAASSRAAALLTLIGAAQLAALWYPSLALSPIGVLTSNSNRLVPRRVPNAAQEIRMFGALLAIFTLLQLEATFGAPLDGGGNDGATFPTGQGPEGLTLVATPQAPMQPGEYALFWLSVQAPIPTADPARFYQYAFVLDSDADPANNYVASPAFEDDFFKDTDRWYELGYAPSTGWTLRCRVVGTGNSITTVPSAVRAILSGDTLLLVVPRSELGVQNPPFRATTFSHAGDFGQNPPYDWSGDPTPTVAEPLRSWM
jgi:hypothetical protein